MRKRLDASGFPKCDVPLLDFHTHILPGIDDGSSDVDETAAMLVESYKQNVGVIVATPHFYPEKESPREFIKRRERAVDNLAQIFDETKMPAICLGAEVAYYTGISVSKEIPALCVYGTPLLLIEMPECRWSDAIINEVINMTDNTGLTPVIAHVDRCFDYQEVDTFKYLAERGIKIQIGTGIFNSFDRRRKNKAYYLLSKGYITFLGSDCHNTTTRKQDMQFTVKNIMSKLGCDFTAQFIANSMNAIVNAKPIYGHIKYGNLRWDT